ncbi:hypothetical protein OCF11_16135 [Bacillus cereus]|nr:hypothetical protein [Bacillus cereus]
MFCRILSSHFARLQHLPSLWTRSYFVSTAGNVSSEKTLIMQEMVMTNVQIAKEFGIRIQVI